LALTGKGLEVSKGVDTTSAKKKKKRRRERFVKKIVYEEVGML